MRTNSASVKALASRLMLGALLALALPITAIGQTTASDFNNRGIDKGKKGDFDGAIADFTRALELDPKDANAYNNRGIAKKNKGDLDGAIADYTHALELNPQDTNAYNNRGNAHFIRNWTDALVDYRHR